MNYSSRYKKLISPLSFLRAFNNNVVIIGDGAGWVIDNVTSNLNHSLNKNGIRSCVIDSSSMKYFRLLKDKVLFFIDRWACLDSEKENLIKIISQKNKIILTWWHSGAGGNNIELLQSIDTVKRISKYLTFIHAPCLQEYNFLIGHGIGADKIKVVPEGIEDFFKPLPPGEKTRNRKRLGIPEDAFCIGYFQKDGIGWGEGNNPKREKGPDIFIETVSMLFKKYGNISIVLTGPSRGYVKEGLRKAGIPFIHEFLKNYQDIVKFYGVLDLYLITSRNEGGPKSVLEAMACGIPVVSTRVGMCSDIIRDNQNGFLCDVENIDQLYEKSEKLILNEELRNKFKENGLETVKSYLWDKVAQLFIKRCLL